MDYDSLWISVISIYSMLTALSLPAIKVLNIVISNTLAFIISFFKLIIYQMIQYFILSLTLCTMADCANLKLVYFTEFLNQHISVYIVCPEYA